MPKKNLIKEIMKFIDKKIGSVPFIERILLKFIYMLLAISKILRVDFFENFNMTVTKNKLRRNKRMRVYYSSLSKNQCKYSNSRVLSR